MSDTMAFRRPMGAVPYTAELPPVTVADLDDAIKYVQQQFNKIQSALQDHDEPALQLYRQTLGIAIAQYQELRTRADLGVVATHCMNMAPVRPTD